MSFSGRWKLVLIKFQATRAGKFAILDIVNAIQTNMNRRLFSCGVFTDLKKAFDTVDHSILLSKFNFYGFRGIINNWFSSYLRNRLQTTQIGQHVSDKVELPMVYHRPLFLALCCFY